MKSKQSSPERPHIFHLVSDQTAPYLNSTSTPMWPSFYIRYQRLACCGWPGLLAATWPWLGWFFLVVFSRAACHFVHALGNYYSMLVPGFCFCFSMCLAFIFFFIYSQPGSSAFSMNLYYWFSLHGSRLFKIAAAFPTCAIIKGAQQE